MRLDQRLVDLGLAASRARAKALIDAGAVTVDGVIARKASQSVTESTQITAASDPNPWVSRAALKLAHALDVFGLTNLELGISFSVYGVVAMLAYFVGGPL